MPNPIHRVLSTLNRHRVKYLLMGGQACIFYGGAEFSRDTDVALLAEPENLERLSSAMRALQAELIAVPPLQVDYLRRGHAVHYRCRHPEADGMRLDVLSVMRGVPAFPILWERRTTVRLPEGEDIELLALPDLVQAKKTQRDKDWPMIRRLVEANYVQFSDRPSEERMAFWLAELRTPGLLREVASRFPAAWSAAVRTRPFLASLHTRTDEEVAASLADEEARERAADRAYWTPLRKELERIRRERLSGNREQ